MRKISFSQTEIKHLLISIFLLVFLFLYNKIILVKDGPDALVFVLQGFLIFSIALFVNISLKKWFANKYGHRVEYRMWSVKRLWFTKSSVGVAFFGRVIDFIPLGIVLPVLVSLFSGGLVIFSAVGIFVLTSQFKVGVGRQRPYITEYETAKIAFIGPLSNLAIALIFSFLLPYYGVSEIIKLNIWMAIFNMFPLPSLDGSKIFFGGRGFYIFCLIFVIIFSIGLMNINQILNVVLALVLAGVASLFYLFQKV